MTMRNDADLRHRIDVPMRPSTLALYIDYKSPYAYLAKDLAYDLARDTGVAIDWLPYTLDVPASPAK